MSKNLRNIGLFGGSFDPIHNEHIQVIETALDNKMVDQVWIIPAGNHAFNKKLTAPEHRIAMIHYATKHIPSIRIDTSEIFSTEKNYSIDTIKRFQSEIPANYFFIAGSDILQDLPKWHNYDELRNIIPFIIYERIGSPIINPGINIAHVANDDVKKLSSASSTTIRDNVLNGVDISNLVNPLVEKHIRKHRLYTGGEEFQNPSSTVDMIAESEEGIVLVKRKFAPFKGFWSFPGGFVNYGVETVEHAAVREFEEETNYVTTENDLILLGVYSKPDRDPRGHTIDHAYIVNKFSGKLKAKDDAEDAKPFKEKPANLAFDHSKIWDDYQKWKENKIFNITTSNQR